MRPELSRNSKNYIPKNLYRQCLYFCRQYHEWDVAIREARGLSGVRYDQDRVQTGVGNPTEAAGMKVHALEQKKAMVDNALTDAVPDNLLPWVRLGVTTEVSVWDLLDRGMPCERKTYYKYRRLFFSALAERI